MLAIFITFIYNNIGYLWTEEFLLFTLSKFSTSNIYSFYNGKRKKQQHPITVAFISIRLSHFQMNIQKVSYLSVAKNMTKALCITMMYLFFPSGPNQVVVNISLGRFALQARHALKIFKQPHL